MKLHSCGLLALLAALSCGGGTANEGDTVDGGAPLDAARDPAPSRADRPLDRVLLPSQMIDDWVGPPPAPFDLSVLHVVKITVEARYLSQLEVDRVKYVPARISYDGQVIENAGLRKKGAFGSWTQLSGKPAFSVNFDEFDKGGQIQGYDKLSLNNCRQDGTFLAEHIGYELYRRAGLPAPATAHAVVVFNDVPKGIYVVKEAINKRFLRRAFGDGNSEGNLYEGGGGGDFDFVLRPELLDLKREQEEMRTRDDIAAFVRAIVETPESEWAAVIGGLLDVPAFITAYAIDGLANHWDSYPYNANNYYLYRRPSDNRFVFLPHGMDSLFRIDLVFGSKALIDVYATTPKPDDICDACGLESELGRKLRALPELDARYRDEVQRILRDVWDLDALGARIDQVATLVRGAKRSVVSVAGDVQRFEQHLGAARKFLADRRAELLR